eukprot:1339843-Rhodomonas_salina.1
MAHVRTRMVYVRRQHGSCQDQYSLVHVRTSMVHVRTNMVQHGSCQDEDGSCQGGDVIPGMGQRRMRRVVPMRRKRTHTTVQPHRTPRQ